jgi:hypothetical protein
MQRVTRPSHGTCRACTGPARELLRMNLPPRQEWGYTAGLRVDSGTSLGTKVLACQTRALESSRW